MKFSVGHPVGGPATYVSGSEPNQEFAQRLLEIPGVVSIFITADFVTVTKTLDAAWPSIQSDAVAILEDSFPG
jgi:Scaffold protein Nfu/NifU N terminal